MLTTIHAARRTLTAMRTRAIAAHHLGAPWPSIVRAALGDARDFAAPTLRAPAPPAPLAHHGARGVRL